MKFLLSVLFSLAVVFSQAGCGETATNVNTSSAPSDRRRVTDDLDHTFSVPAHITRAVSLAPSITESVFAVGAGDRLVGVTTFCNYPEQAKSIAKVGDTINPNLETIISLKPEVVLVSTASQMESFTSTLRANGIPVFVLGSENVDGIFQGLKKLGDLFGTSDRAEKLVADLQRRVGYVVEHVAGQPKVRVFVQISREPLFSVGKRSYMNEVLDKAGAVSVTWLIDEGFPKVSKETAAALQPDAIILSQSDDNTEPNEAFKNSPAVRNNRVFSINADLLSRPGPRLVDAMELMAQNLHK
jgi:iron complex transport system substrate-binding protein